MSLAIGFSCFMVYSFILWGDISPIGSMGTYYGLGFGLTWCAILIGLIFSGSIFGVISEEKLNRLLFFSAITIFLCIPPLLFAKETLPEDIITKKRIERHLKRVLRAREEEDSRTLDK
jgi:MFS family permease